MKKGILPLKLFLIIIVLGGFAIAFTAFNDVPVELLRKHQKHVKSQNIGSSFEFLAKIRNNQITGVINPYDLKVVQDELKSMGDARASTLEWSQLGPDNFGGSTRAIHFDNQSSESPVAYAGAVSGGLWTSVNLGTTWNKINIDTYNLNVSCITQTSNGHLFVGTGEAFDSQTVSGLEQMGYTSSFMGQGIYMSADGENFGLLESTKPQFNDINSDWAFINELAADQSNGRIYAATNTGLKYSDNEGNSWSTAKDADGNELSLNAMDVQVGSTGGVIACVDNLCYVSTDGNVNGFVNRSVGDSVSLPDGDVGRIEFAIAPSDPNVVYAGVADKFGSVYNIYRSDNKGIDWRIILPGTPSISIFAGQGVYSNAVTVYPDNPDRILLGGVDAWQGEKIQDDGYFDWKSVSESFTMPLFPTYVHENHHVYTFVPGTNNQFLIGTDGGIFKGSLNSGEYIYESGNRNYYTTRFYTVANSGVKQYVVGGTQNNRNISKPPPGFGNTDEEGFQIAPGPGGPCVISSIAANVLVISLDDGLMGRSDDYGFNYSSLDQFPNGISNDDVFRTPMVLVENFNNENSGDSLWYHANEDISGGTKITVRSMNSGQPFSFTIPEGVNLSAGDSIQVKDIVTAYYYLGVVEGADTKIYFTKELHRFDKAVEWFEISNTDFGLGGTPYCISVSADGNHMFVGTLEGKLFRISNLATAYNYERADVNSPGCIVSTQPVQVMVPGTEEDVSQVITSISIDANDPNNVMITLGNYGNDHYVLYSENALAQFPEFKSKQGNLAHMPVYSSVIEMLNTDLAIIGTEHGVFTTENIHADSPQWTKQYNNLGSVPVFELKQQIISQPSITFQLLSGNEVVYVTYPGTNNWGSIYAATFGRGLFMCDNFFHVGLDEFTESDQTKDQELLMYPNPVRSSAFIEINSEINSEITIQVYDLTGKMVKSNIESVNKGLNKISMDFTDFIKGTYIISVKLAQHTFTRKFLVN